MCKITRSLFEEPHVISIPTAIINKKNRNRTHKNPQTSASWSGCTARTATPPIPVAAIPRRASSSALPAGRHCATSAPAARTKCTRPSSRRSATCTASASTPRSYAACSATTRRPASTDWWDTSSVGTARSTRVSRSSRSSSSLISSSLAAAAAARK